MQTLIKNLTLLVLIFVGFGTIYSIYDLGIKDKLQSVTLNADSNGIVILSPHSVVNLESPVQIIGKARGTWFFEGQFNAEIVTESGKVIATAPAVAQTLWTTENYVPFSSQFVFESPQEKTGFIRFTSADPSGMGVNNKTYLIVVSFK